MSSNQPVDRSDIETSITVLDESLRQRRFYFRLLGLWAILSLGLTIAFGWIVIAGFKTFPREAQYWTLAITFISLVVTGSILKWQQDAIFAAERRLRQLQTLRRNRGIGPSNSIAAIRERYRAEAWEYVEQERRKAGRNRRFHRSTQTVVVLGSVLVTALTGALAPG